jgi:hypothetical protein
MKAGSMGSTIHDLHMKKIMRQINIEKRTGDQKTRGEIL